MQGDAKQGAKGGKRIHSPSRSVRVRRGPLGRCREELPAAVARLGVSVWRGRPHDPARRAPAPVTFHRRDPAAQRGALREPAGSVGAALCPRVCGADPHMCGAGPPACGAGPRRQGRQGGPSVSSAGCPRRVSSGACRGGAARPFCGP